MLDYLYYYSINILYSPDIFAADMEVASIVDVLMGLHEKGKNRNDA